MQHTTDNDNDAPAAIAPTGHVQVWLEGTGADVAAVFAGLTRLYDVESMATHPAVNLAYRLAARGELEATVGPGKPTAAARSDNNKPLDRTSYANSLSAKAVDGDPLLPLLPVLTAGEVEAVAALLDELAALYHGEAYALLPSILAAYLCRRAAAQS